MSFGAVVLLSGGLDSSVTLATARADGHECLALTFSYGQRHEFEIDCAKRVARELGAMDHRVIDIDLASVGRSALTDEIEVPKSGTSNAGDIPVTYVPARNTLFLSYALAWAEAGGASDIYIGVNAVDYSGYPDCRPEYISAYEAMANLGTKAGVEGRKFSIRTPLIDLSKAQIVERGVELGVDFSMTLTCYDPDRDGVSCGACEACRLRLEGFREAGVRDPLPYRV